MNLLRFHEVEQQVLAHYAAHDYAAALRVLDVAGARLSRQWERVAYWRACLLSRQGRVTEAVDILAQAVEAGSWWSPRLLELETDLEPLWDVAGYRELLHEMDGRRRAWRPTRTGLYVSGVPGGWPFLGLHGRNQIYETDAAHISRSLGEGWEVAIPESSQRIASDGPVWDDAEECHGQVMGVATAMWADRPLVIGGFSQGGRRALQIGLREGRRVRGVLAVAPMVLRDNEITEVISAIGPRPWPLVAIVAGEEDPAARGVATVARHLRDEGMQVMVDIVPGMGHEWVQPPVALLTALAERVAG